MMIPPNFLNSRAKQLVKLTAIVGVSALAVPASATPVQGTLGATSTGSILITASVPNQARITGLTDVTFANQDPNTAASGAQNVCVWSNTATRAYTIKATGSGASNAFTLTNGTDTAAYTVEWAASSGQTSGTALTSGTASSSLTSAATQQICSSGPSASASLIVKMSTAVLGGMTAGGDYTGTLTLLVTPQ
jgi:hypothetical protein